MRISEHKFKLLILSSLTIVFLSSSLKATELSLYTENFKPYQYLDDQGELKGFGIDLIKLIFKVANIEIDGGIRLAIWDNAYQTALSTENTAIFMTVRNNKREKLFKWVGPLAPREMWLYKLKERTNIKVASIAEAKKYLIGGYKSAQTDYLIELGFPNLDIVLKEELNFKKLLAGRIDLMPSSEILMASKLSDAGLSGELVERTVIFDNRFEYYLALHKSVSDETVKKLQSALDQIRLNGQYAEIEKKYIAPYL